MTQNKLRAKTPKTESRNPVLGWIPVPKTAAGSARHSKKDADRKPFNFLTLMLRLLPVWALVIMCLIIAPGLPLQIAGGVINWGIGLLPQRPINPAGEPVFIVEPQEVAPPQSELPAPNWSLDIAPLFTSEVEYWRDRIAQWSVDYRIKPNMIAAIMQIESCGNPQIVSASGDIGLFQVPPSEFKPGEDSTNPDINAGRALVYFGEMLAAVNGDPGLAFAAYHGGPSILSSAPTEWPEETRDYQFWASGIYEDAELGIGESPTLRAWLEEGGANLCAQAAQTLGQ